MTCDRIIRNALDQLYASTQDLLYPEEIWRVSVEATYSPNWAFKFYREYVSRNVPLLIKGGANELPAVHKWNSTFFRQHFGDKQIKVTITPNGYADGVSSYNNLDYFFYPEEIRMSFEEFLDILIAQRPNYVPYLQQQNSNLITDYPEFLSDVPFDSDLLSWTNQAFDKQPDAVNFWMGDERAITSMHKDPYENIYCVIDGHKDFILIPPLDLPYVPYKTYPVKKYSNVTPQSFEVNDVEVDDLNSISADPVNHPERFNQARMLKVRVEKGDLLYLPSLWFHHVRQSHECVAVNFWYDIDYCDPKYCYYKMLAEMCEKQHLVA